MQMKSTTLRPITSSGTSLYRKHARMSQGPRKYNNYNNNNYNNNNDNNRPQMSLEDNVW